LIARPLTTTVALSSGRHAYTWHVAVGVVTGGATTTIALPIGPAVPAGVYRATIALTYLTASGAQGQPGVLSTAWTGPIVVPRSARR
jgi:hypothetical protein